MLPTSTDYDVAAVANIRNPKGRLTITWSDPIIDTGISISNNGENNISDDLHTADTITDSNYKWFLLQGDSLLDGTFCLATELHQTDYQIGWYGNKLSDGSGEFSSPDPALTLTFPAKPIKSVLVAFENTLNEYGVRFTIDIKLGSTFLDVIFVTTNDKTYFSAQPNIEILSADTLILTIEKWSKTSTMVKVLEFYSSITDVYEDDVIKSFSITEEREIRDATNPIGNISSNEISIELQNIKIGDLIDPFFPGNSASLYSSLLKPNRRIIAELGFEFPDGNYKLIPMGTFWSGDFTIKDTSPTMTFTGRDRLEKLRKAIYDDNELDYNKTFYSLIEDICLSARSKIQQLSYENDSDLISLIIPISYIDRKNYFDAIKGVMAACGGQAYMSRLDILKIESSARSNDYTGSPDLFIPKSEYFTKDQPSHYEDIINKLEIETQPLTLGTAGTSLYSSSSAIDLPASATLDPMELKYSSFPATAIVISLSGTGCTPTYTAEYLSWGCILTVSNAAATTGTFTISITGTPYIIKGTNIIDSKDDTSIEYYGEKSYRLPINPLIQRDDIAQDIADDLISFYADPRNDLNLTWRGNPALELGDIIVVPEYQRGVIDNKARFKIYKLQTNYDGTLKQTISARRIDTYT